MVEKIAETDSEGFFKEFARLEDLSGDYTRRGIKDSMFSNFYDQEVKAQLDRCLRVLPHDQNTSGFFITIIRKIKEFDGSEAQQEQNVTKVSEKQAQPVPQDKPAKDLPEQYQRIPKQSIIQMKGKNKAFEFVRCDPKDPDIEFIQAFYGLENFPVEQLITQSSEMNKLYYIQKEVSDYLYADVNQH